jgi:hypothetical protein
MYYPVCRGAVPWTANVTGLILLGGIDGIAFPALCDAVAKGMSSDKLRAITYPNARHSFDMRGLRERTDLPSGSPGYNAEADKAALLPTFEESGSMRLPPEKLLSMNIDWSDCPLVPRHPDYLGGALPMKSSSRARRGVDRQLQRRLHRDGLRGRVRRDAAMMFPVWSFGDE